MASQKDTEDCSLLAFLSVIPDPRMERKRKHPLINVLVIAVCAAICGAETWVDIEDFGESKLDWFSQFLDMSNGVPSHDTFARVFTYLDPADFHEAFYAWVSAVNAGLLEKDQIAIDGKTLRRSFDRANQKSAIHMVNAWSHSASLVLGQIKTESKSNEITAIPKLLNMLNVKGCIVSIDAMGCQTEIAEKIVKKGGDYLLALKSNHQYLFERVKDLFEKSHTGGPKAFETEDFEETSKGHDRLESRKTRVLTQKEGKIMGVNVNHKWPELNSVVRVTSERVDLKTGVISEQSRYYISSAIVGAEEFGKRIRNHWEIENKLHWSLDVQLREDECRKRAGHSAENFSTLRHLALNMVKSEPTKRSVRGKQKKAGWSEDYLIKVLLNDGKSSNFNA